MIDHGSSAPGAIDLARYAELFINRRDTFLSLALAGHWVRRSQVLTERALAAALAGRIALGLYSVDGQGLSRWACLDLDEVSQGAVLHRVIDLVPDPKQALLEASRRGFHLWLLVEPTPWRDVQRWARGLADEAGLSGIEIFPKGPGLNGVRAPLTVHPKDGRVYPIIDPVSGEASPEPLRLLTSRRPGRVPEAVATTPPTERRRMDGSTEHLALVAEIARYTRLRHYGPEQAIGRCPLHDDAHPSLGVLGGFWRCFAGCGEGGLNAFRARMRDRGGR